MPRKKKIQYHKDKKYNALILLHCKILIHINFDKTGIRSRSLDSNTYQLSFLGQNSSEHGIIYIIFLLKA
jgi:hypothetical protein